MPFVTWAFPGCRGVLECPQKMYRFMRDATMRPAGSSAFATLVCIWVFVNVGLVPSEQFREFSETGVSFFLLGGAAFQCSEAPKDYQTARVENRPKVSVVSCPYSSSPDPIPGWSGQEDCCRRWFSHPCADRVFGAALTRA